MNRRILTIILAVLLAVLGTTAVLIYVNKADARALDGKEAVSVLVAKQPIAAGTAVKYAKVLLAKENMPAAAVPSDALRTLEQKLDEYVTSTEIAPGQLLTRRMLVKESKQNDFVLPAGKLAVTIPIESGSVGEVPLQPGFKVAIFNTFDVGSERNGFTPAAGEDSSGNQATRLLLPMVEVISVVAQTAKSGEKSSTKSNGFGQHLVTVAVTQSEAERLIHVLKTGNLSLAQVNDESKVTRSRGVDNLHLFTAGD